MTFKAILIVSLLVGAIAVPLAIAAPMQTYVNAASSGDLLRTQDRDRDQLQLKDCDSNCTCGGAQERTRLQECLNDGVGNTTTNMEQYRYQYEYHRNRAEQPVEA